jgi:type I restriction enzyme, S subunit
LSKTFVRSLTVFDMQEWRPTKLTELCEQITVGYVGPMADEYSESGIPFLRSLNIEPFKLNLDNLKFISQRFHERIRKSTLRPGDVGIVRTGHPGTACVIPQSLQESNCSDLVIVRPGKELNPYFLAAIFNSSFGHGLVGGSLVGVAQQHFNVGVAKELKLLVPSRTTQDKIAAILSAYDDLIANNRRRIALLESMAEEIYREWFVRMRFAGHQDSVGYANLAEEWKLESLADLGTFLNGYAFDPSEWFDEGLPIVKIKELNAGVTVGTPRNSGEKLPDRYRFTDGDIIFSWSGSLVVRVWDQGDAWVNQHLFKVTPRARMPKSFLYLSIKFAIPIFATLTTGATMQHIKRKELDFVKVRVPRADVLAKFDAHVGTLLSESLLLSKAVQKLRQSRDALLPRLISGKLKVDHLDIQLPPSMREKVTA